MEIPPTILKTSPSNRAARPPRGARAAGAVLAGLLAVSSSVIFAPAAQAAVKTMTTDRSLEAWYWSSNNDIRACTPNGLPPQIPGLCPNASATAAAPISPGHLGISVKAGMSDMRSYVMFDMSTIPLGSTVNSMVVTFTVSRSDASNTDHTTEHAANPLGPPDQQPKAPATFNDGGAAIDACIVTVGWGNAEGAPPADRDANDPTTPIPTEPLERNGVDKKDCVHGKNNTKTWTFDITPFAQKWVSGAVFNNGIALLPVASGPTDTWTVELHGAYYANAIQNPATGAQSIQVYVGHSEEVKAKLDYIAAKIPTSVLPPPPAPAPKIPAPQNLVAPPAPSSVPTLTPPPPVQTPISTTRKPASTPWYVWLLLPAGLLGFVTVSRALGSEPEQTGNRVAQHLRERRIQTSGAS